METDDGFRALANPVRRELLRLVRDEPCSVGALARTTGGSQPATSQHLAILRDAGLVSVTRSGRRRLYSARAEGIDTLSRFFEEYWDGALDRLAVAAGRAAADRRSAS